MTKRGKKEINFHLSNRLSYTLIAIFLLVVIGVGVYALTPGVSPNPGHLISEMAPPSPCIANQFLQFDGTNWECASENSLTKSTTAIYTTNSYCTGAGTLTITGTCSTTSISYCNFGNGQNNGINYRTCNGGTTCLYLSSPAPICNNNLLGYLVN